MVVVVLCGWLLLFGPWRPRLKPRARQLVRGRFSPELSSSSSSSSSGVWVVGEEEEVGEGEERGVAVVSVLLRGGGERKEKNGSQFLGEKLDIRGQISEVRLGI